MESTATTTRTQHIANGDTNHTPIAHCDTNHTPIAYFGSSCPLCAALRKVATLTGRVADIEIQNEDLHRRIATLEEEADQ